MLIPEARRCPGLEDIAGMGVGREGTLLFKNMLRTSLKIGCFFLFLWLIENVVLNTVLALFS